VSGGSGSELYVYYRVAQAHVQAAQQTVRDFQHRLRQQHPGLVARVLRRSQEHSDGVTLMEIYAFDDGRNTGIDPALHSRIEQAAAALTPLLSSPRQTEAFDALD
jgi:Domain of unknown function (DUF4936)